MPKKLLQSSTVGYLLQSLTVRQLTLCDIEKQDFTKEWSAGRYAISSISNCFVAVAA
jgi:hypothetical protein